jgi:hypothetical protein
MPRQTSPYDGTPDLQPHHIRFGPGCQEDKKMEKNLCVNSHSLTVRSETKPALSLLRIRRLQNDSKSGSQSPEMAKAILETSRALFVSVAM